MELRALWKPAGAVAAAAAVGAGGYAAGMSLRDGSSDAAGAGAAWRARVEAVALERMPPRSRMLVRSVNHGAPRADGDLYELSADGEVARAGRLACKQVHASPADGGLCLALTDDGIAYDGIVFDADYRPRARFPVEGVPDRARVSDDGRYAAYTTFATGDAAGYFASTSDFSTDTRIVDMRDGAELLRLDSLAVSRDGEPLRPGDRELWGVTFGHRGRYYATLATGSDHYLIEGHVHSRQARVIGEDVECPSLSPDGGRIAYKRRTGDTNRWRLHVLVLATGKDIPLAEPRSIDDQPEWLDGDTIVYSDDRSVHAVPADGTGTPVRLAAHATSPAALGR